MMTISYEDFSKLDIRVGKIVAAEKVTETTRLLRLEVDIGGEKRQLVAGVGEVYSPEELIGKFVPVLVNLEPRLIRGVESQGMVLAAEAEGKPVLLHPDKEVEAGSRVK